MLSFNFASKINISLGDYNIIVGNPIFWIGVFVILLYFLRSWGIKKVISFGLIVSALLFSMFRFDDFISSFFGKEEGNYYALLTKPVFLFLMAFVFIYYAFINRE